jgi:hypothetical protein
MMSQRFAQAIAEIDAANAADPNLVDDNGQQRPLEIVHAERRTHWIEQLVGAAASEALLLAARAQHIERWTIPRDSYPRDRIGYLKWRTDLKNYHAERTATILAEVGYNEATIERVTDLIQKKAIKRDAEAQAIEDALCLVFLETQLSDFAQKEADKIIDILRKTWPKMSPQGQQLALTLPLAEADRAIIEAALQE